MRNLISKTPENFPMMICKPFFSISSACLHFSGLGKKAQTTLLKSSWQLVGNFELNAIHFAFSALKIQTAPLSLTTITSGSLCCFLYFTFCGLMKKKKKERNFPLLFYSDTPGTFDP